MFSNFLTIQIIDPEEIFTPKPKNIHLPNQTFPMFLVIGMHMDMDMNDMIPDPCFWTYLFNHICLNLNCVIYSTVLIQ